MKKYLVEITETLQKQITVSANSREEAEQKVKERYKNEDIILNENDYVDTDFHVSALLSLFFVMKTERK